MTETAKYFVPGPTWVRPEILREMTRPMIGHRSNEFRELFGGINRDLKTLFGTRQTTFVMTASGTGVMQAALENCVDRRVLVTTCGAFSERWYNIAESLGLEVDRLDGGWGRAIDPEELASHLARHQRAHYDAVTITHNETSTGVTNDVAALAEVIREEAPDALILVDSVSALGGIPVEFDQWGIDVCLASVQKAIALPPGITVVAVSDQALARAKKHPYRGTYFDFLAYKEKADDDSVPSTPSIPHFYALAAELEHMLRVEGLEARYERHRRMRAITHERTARYARLAAVELEHASATVTALTPVLPPDTIRAEMKKRGYTLGGGYGQWKDTTFRIGHMGDIPVADLEAMLDVLAEVARG
ncbi:MAG TPA: alanine--glyoxylate aminotransferase family protein [Thermoanaerobaculia bacterium]|nr:alanine--glyoxylate aminotransferase family protein [Thermoanaerobaculia bacterium]